MTTADGLHDSPGRDVHDKVGDAVAGCPSVAVTVPEGDGDKVFRSPQALVLETGRPTELRDDDNGDLENRLSGATLSPVISKPSGDVGQVGSKNSSMQHLSAFSF